MNIRWNQIALAAAAGFLLGAVSASSYIVHRFHGSPPFNSGGPLELFSRELDLTAQQKEKLSVIIEKHKLKIDRALHAREPEIEADINSMRIEIRAILTPEQTAKMQKLEEKIEAQRKEFSGHFPGAGFRPF
jgi:Spy/CpxP family protein refolding chaperone